MSDKDTLMQHSADNSDSVKVVGSSSTTTVLAQQSSIECLPEASAVQNTTGSREPPARGSTPSRADSAAPEKPAAKPGIKPLDIKVPAEIGRYSIKQRIGSGTCGVVHQAVDNLLGRDVAIKLSPIGEAHVSTGKVPGAQRAYQTEIVAAGRLTHANIVTVHDAGQFDDLNYLVMEVIDGKSLKEFGKGKTLLPVHEALRVISQCCRALDYSHAQGILHRDIKPANIMLGRNGVVKLLDFGIAVGLREDGKLKRQGPTLGTPNYMSPEQILGRELGPPSDFYSLATVLFELLTGRQLFKAKKVKDLFRTVVHTKAPALHEVRPEMPLELSRILARALEKKPQGRFQSGLELAEALSPFIQRFRIMERRPAAQQRLVRQLRRQAFFKPFTEVEVAQLLERVQARTFQAGETLIHTGDCDRRLLVITEGAVKLTRNEAYAGTLGEGDCLGESGFINGAAEAQEVSAITTVKALEMSAGALSELAPKVHLHFFRHISDIHAQRRAAADQVPIDINL